MAIKDWKKATQKDLNLALRRGHEVFDFINKKTGEKLILERWKRNLHDDRAVWDVDVLDVRQIKKDIAADIKTKPQALKFMKAYMKKN
jgi:hypothetical protein